MIRICSFILVIICLLSLGACSYSRKFTKNYYKENEALLQSIQIRYKKMYEAHPFSLEIKDKKRERLGIEIITDSIKYIYSFNIDAPDLSDTLRKYKFDVAGMQTLLDDMQRAHCSWITNLDYYEGTQKKYLVFLSVRHKDLEAFLKAEKYFTLAFFDQPQPIDDKGRLLDREDKKKFRKINDTVFRTINRKVFYALRTSFR